MSTTESLTNGSAHHDEPSPASAAVHASPTPAQLLQQAHAANENGAAPVLAVSTVDPFPALGASSDASTVDPFPVAATSSDSAPPAAAAKPKPVDVSDESAFPSLGGSTGPKKAGPTWGSGGSAAARIKLGAPTPASSNGASRAATPVQATDEQLIAVSATSFSARVQLPAHEITIHAPPASRGGYSSREQAPTTLGEVMKLLMKKHPIVTVEASTSKNVTTFLIKAKGPDAQVEGAAVQRELLSRLAKQVKVNVEIPSGLRALIIGSKGARLGPRRGVARNFR